MLDKIKKLWYLFLRIFERQSQNFISAEETGY